MSLVIALCGRRWLHVACTGRLTLLGLGPRSREGANALGVLPEFRGGVVHDALALYDGYPDARHQLCGAHFGPPQPSAGRRRS